MKDRIQVLDGWRLISVTMVIAFHLERFSSIATSGPPRVLDAWAPRLGVLGVQIFFVISGFVICRALIKEASEFGRISLPGFYVRRFFRIIPPLILYVATVIALTQSGFVKSAEISSVRGLTFTCNFPGADCGYLGGHTWSLSVEEQFYLAIPALFLVMNEHRRAATALLLIIPITGLFATPGIAAFVGNFVYISVGVACALNERWIREKCSHAPRGLLFVAILGLILAVRASYSQFSVPAQISVALLIAAVLMLSIENASRFTEVLSSSPATSLGRASYGIYLWQQLATYPFAGAGPAFFVPSLTLCVAGSLLMFVGIESRLIAVGRAFSRRLERPPNAGYAGRLASD